MTDQQIENEAMRIIARQKDEMRRIANHLAFSGAVDGTDPMEARDVASVVLERIAAQLAGGTFGEGRNTVRNLRKF